MKKNLEQLLISLMAAIVKLAGLWIFISALTVGQTSIARETESSSSNNSMIDGKFDNNSNVLDDGSYFNTYKFEAEASEQLTSQVSPQEELAEAERLNQQVIELYQQGKYDEAIPLAEQELAINKKILGASDITTADSLNNLAALYNNQGRYSEAEPLYQEALAITKEQLGDQHSLTATSLNNLALLYKSQGRYSEAEPLYQEALAIYKEQLGDKDPLTAISLNNLAALYYYQGRYSEAEPLYQEALAIYKEQLGNQHPSTATSLNNLALLYEKQGRYNEAEPLLKEVLNIRKTQLEENYSLTAISLNNLAALYNNQGRYSEAESLSQEALAITKEQLGDKHPSTATSLIGLATVYESQGRYSEAEPLYQEALTITKEQLGDKHPSTAISLNHLTGFYYSQGDLSRSIEYLTKGVEVEEYNLSENLIAGDEKQKQDFIVTVLGTTYGVISLNLQSLPNNPDAKYLALKTILQRKGRILDVSTNSLQILRQRTDDPESQQLLTQLMDIRTQYANLIFEPSNDIKSPDIYRQQLIKLNTKAKQLENKLSRRSAEFRNLSQPITLEAIQKLIPADATLVELVRYQPFNPKAPSNERFGNPRYAAYILYQSGELQAIDLGEAEIIDKEVQKFRKYLRNKVPIKQLKSSARKLDKLVMQPVRQLLGDTNNILLSPDADLNLIPFEALVDENNQYLVENYHFTYLTSGRDLLRLKTKYLSQQPPLVLADPLYNQPGEVAASNRTIEDISQLFSNMPFARLEGTANEAQAIQKLFSLPEDQIKTQKQATENVLKQVKSPSFLHIATHGFFLPPKQSSSGEVNVYDNPLLRSGLVFAGVESRQSGEDDGIMTAYETTLLNLLGTKLVVLSACDTGVGDSTSGEGIYGLRRALVIAGSESQVISLWKVSDNATKDLMIGYYENLKGGQGRSEALHEIQRKMLRGELKGEEGLSYEHPYYWASFIPSGDWTPMEFSLYR